MIGEELKCGDGSSAPVRVALWGISRAYRESINLLLAMQEFGQISLVCVVDVTPPPVSLLDGMPVVTPDELSSFDFDYLLLMSANNEPQMLEAATCAYGVPRSKVRTHRLLQVPGMDLRAYKRLCDARLSIVSNNRWGGLVCQALEMECRSPFRDCFFKEQDYLRLLENLEEYLAIDDVPLNGEKTDAWGDRFFSFALGDVELRLYDDEGPTAALEKWFKGREKLNRDRLFVQISTTDPKTEERFESMGRHPRRVCFVPYETKMSHSIQLPMLPRYNLFEFSVNQSTGARGSGIAFNLVSLLLGEGDPRRYVLKGV